jgi:hypothetical protein
MQSEGNLMNMTVPITTVDTFEAKIYCGLNSTKKNINFDVVYPLNICREYCNKVGLCVTISKTRYIYTGGYERGIVVGLINYPRFPASEDEITKKALELAEMLMDKLGQKRVTVVTSKKTYMLGEIND